MQVNTGAGCHLDAPMVQRAMEALRPDDGSLLFVENVGNLVCPALFDVGEQAKVVIISVTEGSDKPLKYPHMFSAADLVVINKSDLLPYVDFDADAFAAVRPQPESRRRDFHAFRQNRRRYRPAGTTGSRQAQSRQKLGKPQFS